MITLDPILLAAEAVLSDSERAAFVRSYPSTDSIADRLNDQLARRSHHLEITNLQKKHGHEIRDNKILAVAVLVCAGIAGPSFFSGLTWDDVRAMYERIDQLSDPSHALAERLAAKDSELAKAKKLELLAPLGFTDARVEDAPDAIYHPVFGVIDHKAITLENLVAFAHADGRIHGRNELRNELRPFMEME